MEVLRLISWMVVRLGIVRRPMSGAWLPLSDGELVYGPGSRCYSHGRPILCDDNPVSGKFDM